MTHGSLFSGIGGFDLAAEWMGWTNVFHCEYNPFGQKVLKYYWPDSISYGDIKLTDFTIHRGQIDVLSGGFPCQPFSTAGKRQGTDDDRHLWPEMLRAVREIQPRHVVGENVRGLTNWSGGLVFDQVQADLEAEGYEVLPFLLPACAVNAPHRRDRIWFVAHANSLREGGLQRELGKPERGGQWREGDEENSVNISTNPQSIGQPRQGGAERSSHSASVGNWKEYRVVDDGRWPTQPIVRGGNDGLSSRLDGITLRKWAESSIMAYGNAIVPQVAFEIFKAISQLK